MMPRKHVLLALILGLGATVSSVASPVERPVAWRRSDGPCAGDAAPSIEYHYTVSGRARPLVVWTGRRDVGAAIVRREANTARRDRITLVIGTDPTRAPLRMNRWGYTSEARCGERTDVVGLMTQSDEQTVGEATVSLTSGDLSRPYRAIRATVDGTSAKTETLRVNAPGEHTYRDARSILDALPAAGTMRSVPVPAGASPGFLFAVDAALRHAIASPHRAPATFSYVYGLHTYDLAAAVTGQPVNLTIARRTYARTITVDFLVRNRNTGERTRFEITAGASGDLTGVPLRVVYRPRWWLELELQLDGGQP